jgi:glycosyltransferase involved in cell wall biosynthesis
MRIVSVLTSDAAGGAEFAAVEMLDALVDRGHEAVLLSDQPAIGRDTAVRIEPVHLGPKLSTRTYIRLGLSWPRLLRRLRAALAREAPYDVLLVHYKKEQLLAPLLPERLRATTVWAEWGPVPYPMRHGPARLAYVAAARRAQLVMAVSSGTLESVREVGVPADKLRVVPNVVRADEIRFRPEGRAAVRSELGIPADAAVVGCISRLHPKKRNDVVIDAVKSLPPETHLIIAGEGETEADLRAQAAPLEDRAHFIPTPRANVADVLSAFDVSVFCPSPTEGAPRAVIIAMLAERPCVATGAEGVADMLDSDVGGITAPENDPDALTALLAPLLEDSEARRTAGREARRRAVERFSAPVVAELAEGLLLEARQRSGRPKH